MHGQRSPWLYCLRQEQVATYDEMFSVSFLATETSDRNWSATGVLDIVHNETRENAIHLIRRTIAKPPPGGYHHVIYFLRKVAGKCYLGLALSPLDDVPDCHYRGDDGRVDGDPFRELHRETQKKDIAELNHSALSAIWITACAAKIFQDSHLLNHGLPSFFDSFVFPRSANWQRAERNSGDTILNPSRCCTLLKNTKNSDLSRLN